ncbi:probable inactive receptor kinase At5g58300 [Rutidosis leptorrhynchoides]|uniref:probable inactive receptor kinase At5g58300 n=1 Tax=Rutidosis leptorrhynchoides TaxID=125765 RepID=UPI003A99423E
MVINVSDFVSMRDNTPILMYKRDKLQKEYETILIIGIADKRKQQKKYNLQVLLSSLDLTTVNLLYTFNKWFAKVVLALMDYCMDEDGLSLSNQGFAKILFHGTKYKEESCRSSLCEYDEIFIGCMENEPLVPCDDGLMAEDDGFRWKLKDVMCASVGVVGESMLGVSEKVVFSDSSCYVLKRFRIVGLRRAGFGRRVARLAAIGQRCAYIVPIKAYLYSKRFKFVVCDYYPMGSLHDLLLGAREHGHTPLTWKKTLKIIIHIARAIHFIHSLSPSRERNMIFNVHGNLKASNIMIDVDFNAYVSNYGFNQLATEVFDADQPKLTSPQTPCKPSSQKKDIYNFGLIVLDILGGAKALESIEWEFECRKEIKVEKNEFFEFPLKGKDRWEVLKVWDMALECTNRSREARPSIENILSQLNK